ncbi:hypothetical protein MFLAVUS_010589 [Mucor flavus]|uniref:Uncharacterized protein n=1 Tax=Mucor flavus TaxID=439312 RepID=A0ABP9ZD50_9FUNG
MGYISNATNDNNDDSILQMAVRASITPNIINRLGPYTKRSRVHVGPGVDFSHSRISSNTCNIFIRSASQEQLMRQLTSQFGKISTYKLWRSSLNNFNTALTMPATTVTLCRLPSVRYGLDLILCL